VTPARADDADRRRHRHHPASSGIIRHCPHIVYATAAEGPGLVTGWHDRDRMGAEMITRPTLLSTIKLRQAGFAGCRDSDDVIRRPVDELQDRRLIPHQGWPSP
jgi:hypothetical protein